MSMTSRSSLSALPFRRAGLLATLALWASVAAAATYPYRFHQLRPLGKPGASTAYAVNGSGVVAGYASSADRSHAAAARWDLNKPTDLGPPGMFGMAYAINDAGAIVGFRVDPSVGELPTLWWQGQVITLPGLGSGLGDANAMNNAGQIAGRTAVEGGSHATLWAAGQAIDLGTLGGNFSTALGMNDSGQVVGQSLRPDGRYRPTLWSGGTLTDLGTLNGEFGDGLAYDINNSGSVVGCSQRPSGHLVATLWAGGTMTDLDGLTSKGSCIYAINDAGVAVGVSYLTHRGRPEDMRATRWIGRKLVDLNLLMDQKARDAGWVLMDARAISENGEIVGTARNAITGGYHHAYTLRPRRLEDGAAR